MDIVIDESLTNKEKSEKTPDDKVRLFQRKIYLKAKREKDFKFYVLYDKLYLGYFLQEAWRRVKANKGSAGHDGISISDIEEKIGVTDFLLTIQEELQTETYKAQPIQRVYIPKANGKLRPLGIPNIKDRVVQMCCKMVIEPIFEADFEDCSYGFRPRRSAKNAITEIKSNLKKGYRQVYDADLSGFFDNIPHDKLMIMVEKRITDKRILKLLRQWLKTPYYDENNKLHKTKKGTPQGGVISPLLANIYLNVVDKAVNRANGYFQRYGIKMVRYADDFILMGSKIPQHCLEYLKKILDRMGLSLNEEKTSLIDSITESFDFLGFTFRYDKDLFGGSHKYLNIVPSKKSVSKIRDKIRTYLRFNVHKNRWKVAADLSLVLRGWSNYFTIKGVSYPNQAKGSISYYLMNKLYLFYQRKSQRKSKLYRRNAYKVLIQKYKMYNITPFTT